MNLKYTLLYNTYNMDVGSYGHQSLDFLPIIILKCHPLVNMNIYKYMYRTISSVWYQFGCFFIYICTWVEALYSLQQNSLTVLRINRYSFYFFVVSLFILNLYMTWGSTQQNSLKVLSIKSTDTVLSYFWTFEQNFTNTYLH